MNCALLIVILLARMSDLSEWIDKLDDDGVIHSTDSTTGFGPRAVGVVSHVTSSNRVPFTDLFYPLLIGLFFLIFTNTFASLFGRVFFWES